MPIKNMDQEIGIPVVLPNYEPWTPVTLTSSITTNVASITAKRKISFETAEYDVVLTFNGANTQGSITFNLPTGDVIDTTAFVDYGNFTTIDGGGTIEDASGIGRYLVIPGGYTANAIYVYAVEASSTVPPAIYLNNANTNANRPVTFATGDKVRVRFKVPLVRLAGGMSAYGAGMNRSGGSLVDGVIPLTSLTSADLTSQTGFTIEPTDVFYCRYSMTNKLVWFGARLDALTITAVSTVSFALPASVPRPNTNYSGIGILYDASGGGGAAIGHPVEIQMQSNGLMTFSKLSAGGWVAGTNNAYLRFQLCWPIP